MCSNGDGFCTICVDSFATIATRVVIFRVNIDAEIHIRSNRVANVGKEGNWHMRILLPSALMINAYHICQNGVILHVKPCYECIHLDSPLTQMPLQVTLIGCCVWNTLEDLEKKVKLRLLQHSHHASKWNVLSLIFSSEYINRYGLSWYYDQ